MRHLKRRLRWKVCGAEKRFCCERKKEKCAWPDLNQQPRNYEFPALTLELQAHRGSSSILAHSSLARIEYSITDDLTERSEMKSDEQELLPVAFRALASPGF